MRRLLLLSLLLLTACSGGATSAVRTAATRSPDPVAAPATGATPDWPGYHRDPARTGYDPATPAVGRLARAWTARTDAAVYASPLVVGGRVIAASEGNTVYAFDLRTGRRLWSKNLGVPVPQSALPCGNINPLGITGTPVYDAATRTVFLVTTTLDGRRTKHLLVGLDPATGTIRGSAIADPPHQDPTVENQRGALAVVDGQVLIPYGGHAGDCGAYHGDVVSLRTSFTGGLVSFRAGTRGEAGFWATSGIAVDAAGFAYAANGNGAATSPPYDGSDAVVKLDPKRGLRLVDSFTESGWARANAGDVDLGSTGPLLVAGRVWQQGKSSKAYLQPQARLGGPVSTPVTTGACARQFGGAAAHGPVVFAACTDGIRQVIVLPSGGVRLGWKAPSPLTGSPVVGGGAVWTLDVGAGRLHALAETSGRDLGSVDVGAVSRFASPALSGGLALVPTTSGITAVSGA